MESFNDLRAKYGKQRLSKIPCWMTEGHRTGGYLSGMNTRMVIKITLRTGGGNHNGQVVRGAARLISDGGQIPMPPLRSDDRITGRRRKRR